MANVVELGAGMLVRRQAREWLVRMDGDEALSEAEREALSEWMNRSAAHREELVRLCRFWKRANILTELLVDVDEDQGCEPKNAGPCRPRGPLGHRRSWIIGAALMVAGAVVASVVLAYSCLESFGGTVTREYATAIGQRETIGLSDGSSIQLNTDSRVRVTYSGVARTVRLLQGEAFFSVVPDRNRMFEVYAADSTVRGMGTGFVVQLEGRRVDVAVVTGGVDIWDVGVVDAVAGAGRASVKDAAAPSGLGRLRAGEVTRFESGSGRMEAHQLDEARLQRRVAWREGRLAFSGEPLSEVVAELNRYSTTTVVIGDERLGSMGIFADFRIEDPHRVVEFLSTGLGIRARRVDERTIRLEGETE